MALAALAAGAAGLTFMLGCPGASSGKAARRPSILLVTIDSLRADRLGYSGHAAAATPNLDALAKRSISFRAAQTPSPLTMPALASLHTGRSPESTGVRLDERHALPASHTTLAEALAGAGYKTAAFAGTSLLHPKFGLDQGFGIYQEAFAETPRPRETPVVGILAGRLVDKALEWLETGHRESFFLWINFHDPHYFYAPPPPFDVEFAASPYDGEIAYVDRELGRVLGRMKEYGVDESTMILLAGNHGEGLMDHGEAYHGTLLYQSTLHVPLLIKPAGSARDAGREIGLPVSLMDLMPTALEAAGIPAPSGMQGRSLAAALGAGGVADIDPDRPLYAETMQPAALFGWRPLAAVRAGRWKYISAQGQMGGRLFDLQSDPSERQDVASVHPDVASRLAGELARSVSLDTPLCQECGVKVRSLGYVWPPEGRPAGEEIDPEARIEVANDALKAHRTLQRMMVEGAELIYKDVLAKDPDNHIALVELGWISANRQNLEEAKRLWARAQRLYSDDGELYHLFGHLAQVGRPDQPRATDLFQLAGTLDPLNEEALYDAACGMSLAGKKEEALDLLGRAIAAGFKDYRHMRRDTDLDPIRGEARFVKLVPALEPAAGAPKLVSPSSGPGGPATQSPARSSRPASPPAPSEQR